MIHNIKKFNNYFMKKNLIKNILLILFIFTTNVSSKETNYLIKGIEHFKNKEFEKSKIFFERDLVFNPKSEKSYLYLAKIFMEKENIEEEEINEKAKKCFKKVVIYKPLSSKKESKEIYIFCKGVLNI